MYCHYCKARIDSDSLYCKHCGRQVVLDPEQMLRPVKRRRRPWVAILILLLLAALAAGGGFAVSKFMPELIPTLLQKAGLVFPVRASSCDTLPLGTGGKEANQKLLFFDTGVYLTECGLDTAGLLAAEAFDEMNKGSVVEMQTGLELIKSANPYGEASLFYWYRSGANAEVDYVIEKDSAPVPVEVKASGKGSMQSMTAFLERFPDTPYGIRVSLEDFSSCDRIRVCPVYAVSRLK